MDSEQKSKSKPYFIEVYNSKDNSLLNKYKFVLAAGKVTELRDKIAEKLIAKDQMKKESKYTLKDADDYELGSDDEVEDVVPDGKVRIYITDNVATSNNPEVKQPPKIDKEAPQQNQPPQQAQQPSVLPVSQVPSQVNKSDLEAVNSTVLNIANLVIPKVSEGFPKEQTLTVFCPQIRKTPFALQGREGLSFLEFSQYVVKQFNLDANLKALIFDEQGQALLFCLDLMNTMMPKINYEKEYTIIFTATPSVVDQVPVNPNIITSSPVELKITRKSGTYTYNIDLDNTLSVLKYLIFQDTKIHPGNQIIKFANNPLINDLETLKSYGLKAGSIMELNFKQLSNICPPSFSYKFHYKDVQLINPQETESYRSFKSNLLAFTYHMNQSDKNKFISFLRFYSHNRPLCFALQLLFNSVFVSQVHRIALEEGIYHLLWEHAASCNPTPKTEVKNLLTHTRDFFGFVLENFKHTVQSEPEINNKESVVVLQDTCVLTAKPIKVPGLIKLDNESVVIIDRMELEEQIKKGFTFTELKNPTVEHIFMVDGFVDHFNQLLKNQVDNDKIATIFRMSEEIKPIEFTLPASKGPISQFEPVITTLYPDLKVHQPLQIKNKVSIYLLLKNKEQEYRIYVSKNKDINRPHNIFDVISGNEVGVNLDLMMAAGKTENLEEVVDQKDLKPVITREPKEAIVVLFDISGSMGSRFFNEQDLKRIGAVKLFFEAFAYRTIAYNFEHAVSLIFFDYQIEVQCDFTEAIFDFSRLVSAANPRGSTRLYDSIITGVGQLLAFKKRYPDCILRIIAMTDGEDTGSTQTIFDAAKSVITNGIIMDSFAVGANCEGLKNITLATGGKCYLARNMTESLKLFEQETVLSVRSRKVEPMFTGTSDTQIRECLEKAKYKPFDLADSVHEFKMPEIKGPGISSKDIAKKFESEEGQKKLAGNSSLKRIMKEIENYNKNPHPFVSIYPCSNINIWKILLLGPKETPYENGLFILYANFPGDYPFRAPEVRFITPIYHCNMNQQGRICHSVFDRNYSPALSFRQIIDCVYGLILTPEPEDPLDNVIASYYLSEYSVYLKNATEATKKNASKSTQEIVEELFGKIGDDIERQKKVEEIKNWVELAKSFN